MISRVVLVAVLFSLLPSSAAFGGCRSGESKDFVACGFSNVEATPGVVVHAEWVAWRETEKGEDGRLREKLIIFFSKKLPCVAEAGNKANWPSRAWLISHDGGDPPSMIPPYSRSWRPVGTTVEVGAEDWRRVKKEGLQSFMANLFTTIITHGESFMDEWDESLAGSSSPLQAKAAPPR